MTRFQFVSTALTVTLNALPAVRPAGVPVLPVAVPGAAVYPGISNWSFANVAAFTATAGLVLAAFPGLVISLAVKVRLPAVRSVTLKFWVPFASAAFDGRIAFASLEVMPTVSAAVFIRFQFASTALTVT